MNNTKIISDDIKSIESRYQRAQALEQGVFTKKVALNTTLFPHWISNSDCFWYIRDIKTDNTTPIMGGKEYRLVNAKTAINTVAFNHRALSDILIKITGKSVDADNLPIKDVEIKLSPLRVVFSAFDRRWTYHEEDNTCQEINFYPQNWKISPCGKKAIFIRDYNLWLKNLTSGQEKPLTLDGEKYNVYAGTPTVYGRQEAPSVEALWSPDSQRIFTVLIDTRNVKVGPPLVQHVPTDGSLRPKIQDPDRRVAFPEDEYIEAYRFLAIDIGNGNIQYADYHPCPVFYPPYLGYFTGCRGWWANDSRHAYFIDQERGGKTLRLISFDTLTGKTKKIIEENSDFSVTLIPLSHLAAPLMPLPETDEFIWFSERSGWAHLYLYDLTTGELKNSITQGEWLVRNILHYEATHRELLIQTASRKSDINPYYCDICRVNIDTGQLTPILSTDHDYVVCDQRSRISYVGDKTATGVSPCGRFVVATRSRVDEVPVSVLFSCDGKESSSETGKELLTVETANVSGLPKNWQWPEPVMLKAADNTTDIYGVIFRPSDFSPDNSYPILDCTNGYSAPIGSFSNSPGGIAHYLSPAAYAELGFIVVKFNNRGNEGLRNTSFNTYHDPLLPLDPMQFSKYYKTDCIAGIKQLAQRYPYMDLNRVGIAEFGSIPTALAGLLLYPDFYKVGVSNNPKADNRLMASLGMWEGDYLQFEDFAANLRGKLLLMAGMLDDVLPVSMTFRIVDALQKANKDFDMLLLPNLGHELSGYTTRRAWDYLVTHLLDTKPPENFKLTIGMEVLMDELAGDG